MEIEYIYSDEDYETVCQARARHSRFYWLHEGFFWLLLVANLALGSWSLWLNYAGYLVQDHFLTFLNFGVAAVLLLVRYVTAPMYRRWYLNQQMMGDRNVRLAVDDQGVRGAVGGTRTEVDWNAVIRTEETPGHFLIWINKLQAFSIPKTALPVPDGVERLRAIIAANAANGQDGANRTTKK